MHQIWQISSDTETFGDLCLQKGEDLLKGTVWLDVELQMSSSEILVAFLENETSSRRQIKAD